MKAKIGFNVPEEFLDELKAGGLLEPIVRITKQFQDSGLGPNIRHVFVVATALRVVGEVAQLIELKRYCGQYWGGIGDDKKVIEHADEIQAQIENGAKALGLEVRAGVYE